MTQELEQRTYEGTGTSDTSTRQGMCKRKKIAMYVAGGMVAGALALGALGVMAYNAFGEGVEGLLQVYEGTAETTKDCGEIVIDEVTK